MIYSRRMLLRVLNSFFLERNALCFEVSHLSRFISMEVIRSSLDLHVSSLDLSNREIRF